MLQNVFTGEILPNVELTCVSTDKFKTGCISVNLITQLDSSSASKNALIPRVLRRGTSEHPDMGSLSAALDELYGARVVPVVRKKGELQCVGFYSDFIDDDFAGKGSKLLEKVASLIGELLLSPETRGGLLLSEYVDSERKNLIDEIRAGVNDKRRYALDRLFQLMCEDEAYGVNSLGSEASASSITARGLTKGLRELAGGSEIKIIYCGSAPYERVSLALREALAPLPRTAAVILPGTEIRLNTASEEPRIFREEMDVAQGKLTVGFRMGSCMTAPNYAALMVFNAVYGGAVTSKLFMNVREKLSLCYYASSMLDKHKGIMAVSSGVEFSKYDEALAEILAQLEAVKSGDVSDWELTSAKRAVITQIKSALDTPGGMESLYFDQSVSDFRCTPDELAGLADAVTLDEVVGIASGVLTDSIYFLTGNGGAGNET